MEESDITRDIQKYKNGFIVQNGEKHKLGKKIYTLAENRDRFNETGKKEMKEKYKRTKMLEKYINIIKMEHKSINID